MDNLNVAPVDYRDRWLVILLIPAISLFNYYLTYTTMGFTWFFLLTFVLDTLEGYCAWFAARWFILRLDKRMPWESHLAKRLMIQIPSVCAIILVILISLTELVNFIATDKPIPKNFYRHDIFIFIIWAIFISFLYLSLYFFRRYQQTRNQKNTSSDAHLLIKSGKVQKRIAFESFTFFFVSNELVYGITSEGKIPLPGYTLDRLEKILRPDDFFRANRQCILTRSIVDQIRKEENGKLAVFIKGDVENPVMISRLRAPGFKKWMEG